MKSFILALMAAFFVTACGLPEQIQLTENEAIEVLQGVPMADDETNAFGEFSDTSYDELERLLTRLSGSSNSRMAWGSGTNKFGTLRNLFTLLQSGQADSASSLANALVDMDGGDTVKTTENLDDILGIIGALAPFISAFFPQWAPIIQAILELLPIILAIIG